MFYNKKLIGITSNACWSGAVITAGATGTAWSQYFNSGTQNVRAKTETLAVRCVKK